MGRTGAFTTPKQARNSVVTNYRALNDASYYDNFSQGNEDLNGPPELEIDPLTGLPKELLAMEEIVREQQSIKVHIEKRRYGKLVTVIDGIGKGVDISDLAKQLKTKCATGGTSKGGLIELQGDHTKKVNEVLSDMGFPVEVQ